MKKLENKNKEQVLQIQQLKDLANHYKSEGDKIKQDKDLLSQEMQDLKTNHSLSKTKEMNASQVGESMSQFRGSGVSYFSTFEEVDIPTSSQFNVTHGALEDNIKKEFFDQAKVDKKKQQAQQKQKETQGNDNKEETQIRQKQKSQITNQDRLKKQKQMKQFINENKVNTITNKSSSVQSKPKPYKVPAPIKRDPYEEFFELNVKAVKLNSPYMDDILGINTSTWYKQVIGELIPFHQWHDWIKEKIHGIRDELIKSREKSLLYSKREQQENEGIFQKKPQIHKIGSIRNNKVNYHIDEQFFSTDDVPQQAMASKTQMQQLVDPDLLGLRPREWNNSTSVPLNPLAEETHERKLIKIKLGLFDQPQPVQKEKYIEPGTDTRNDYTGWNVSTQAIKTELDQNLLITTQYAKTKNKDLEHTLLQGYVTPVEAQKIQNENLRKCKQMEKDYRDQIREQYVYENPAASKEKVDGAVFRLTYENQLKQKQIIQDPAITFKPDTSQSGNTRDRITKFVKSKHTGVYELNRNVEKDEDGNFIDAYVWSCCMSEDQNGPGCQKIVGDKGKWNYASYNQN